jgi:hypothetical protein
VGSGLVRLFHETIIGLEQSMSEREKIKLTGGCMTFIIYISVVINFYFKLLGIQLFQTSSDVQFVKNETYHFEVGFVASDIDTEIDECINDVSTLIFSHPIKSSSATAEKEEIMFDEFNFSTQYDLTKVNPFDTLDIVIKANQKYDFLAVIIS